MRKLLLAALAMLPLATPVHAADVRLPCDDIGTDELALALDGIASRNPAYRVYDVISNDKLTDSDNECVAHAMTSLNEVAIVFYRHEVNGKEDIWAYDWVRWPVWEASHRKPAG